MSYWQFRLGIYRRELHNWLESLKQISLGLASLFPLALPALALIPLLALGVLVDTDSDNSVYLNTLWGYLLLLSCWMLVQREGILASRYADYDASLPVSQRTRQWTELGVLLVAAHVFVLGPLLLLIIMLVSKAEQIWYLPLTMTAEALLPATGLLVLASYYAINVVSRRCLPWLSLLLVPMVAVNVADALVKAQWLVIWLGAILIERVIPLPKMPTVSGRKGLWAFYWQAQLEAPRPEIFRGVALLLLIILAGIYFHGVNIEVQSFVSYTLSFIAAMLVGTNLRPLISLRQRYGYYLASMPLSHNQQMGLTIGFAGLLALPALGLLTLAGLFQGPQWGLFLLTYAATQFGLVRFPRYFLAAPVSMAAILFAGLELFG